MCNAKGMSIYPSALYHYFELILPIYPLQEKPPKPPTAVAAAAAAAATGECKSKLRSPSSPGGDKPSGSKMKSSNVHTKLQECQYCHRTFNARAFDNHVKWCQEKSVEALFQKQTSETNTKAMERMKARMQYKPPVPK